MTGERLTREEFRSVVRGVPVREGTLDVGRTAASAERITDALWPILAASYAREDELVARISVLEEEQFRDQWFNAFSEEREQKEAAERQVADLRAVLASAQPPKCKASCSQAHGAPSWDGHDHDCPKGLWLAAHVFLDTSPQEKP